MRKIILLLVTLAIVGAVWIFTPFSFEVYKLIAGKNFTETIYSNEFSDGESFVIKNDGDLKHFTISIEDESLEMIVQKDSNISYVLLNDTWYKTNDSEESFGDIDDIINIDQLFDSSNYAFDTYEKKFVLKTDADIEFMGLKPDSITYKNYFYKIVFELKFTEIIDNGGIVETEERNLTLTFDNFFMTKVELPSDYEDIDDWVVS